MFLEETTMPMRPVHSTQSHVLLFSVALAISCTFAVLPTAGAESTGTDDTAVYSYTLAHETTAASYDESMAVACLQGIVNRDRPRVYLLSKKDNRPEYWRKILLGKGRWLEGKTFKPLADLDALVELARPGLKGAIIWDPEVPASVNVATTIAGVEDGVVLSPEYAEKYLGAWKLDVLADLRGRFTGEETGSKKNDAYRWAIREYLRKGRCSAHFLCLYEDAFSTRAGGNIGYVLTRDWALKQRAFVYDLSPWGDEVPGDDPGQRLGTDLATYRMMLEATLEQSAPDRMTEVTGFFPFAKYSNVPGHASAHDPVPTEWETVWLISPYNCYQNTISSDCFNQSFHSQAPWTPLKQRRPAETPRLANKAYVSILMADYDSATPLYSFLPKHWDDPKRGQVPLAWGINPNLIETYPDIIAYLYETATAGDYFTADASAAGYMNPNRIEKEYLSLFVRHNRHFFQQTDITIAPMVLDWDQPSAEVKDAFTQFSPDGFATIVMDLHQTGGRGPKPHLWKGMPVTNLINSSCNYSNPEQTADAIYASLKHKPADAPGFFFFRIVWVGPSQVIQSMETLRKKHPELEVELVDPYTFFRLFKQHASK
jgi:putative glycoside hydrolase with GxGYxYP motif/GxGYxY motif-containing protein